LMVWRIARSSTWHHWMGSHWSFLLWNSSQVAISRFLQREPTKQWRILVHRRKNDHCWGENSRKISRSK
jgi:hypothetical protein